MKQQTSELHETYTLLCVLSDLQTEYDELINTGSHMAGEKGQDFGDLLIMTPNILEERLSHY